MKIIGAAILALAAASLNPAAAAAAPSGKAATAAAAMREVLPKAVVPLHYDLALHPDAGKMAFSGEVRIEVEAKTAVPAIVLNAKDLVFDEARLEDGRVAAVTLDPQLERASLSFAGGVTPGRHTLAIRYHGAIGRSTIGFFAMDYQAASGAKRRVLATNFEPASERMLMPSWDEPGLKATFSVSVDTPSDQMAIGNMPVESETPLAGGMKRVRFAVTPRMSTYLLFLAIGDYERISDTVDGVKVGVVVARGETERARYALKEATALLHYYDGYFGVRFPLPKLDLVVAPGSIEGGSMENWGGIFYSQEHLLFDPATSTEADRQLVFLVVAHEMAHQWFGDLVTMGWWDNLWLNEGFARWMQTKVANDLHPEWETGLQAASIIEQGMRADAKSSTHAVEQPVRSAAEAELAFDEITYDKGATVIGMLEHYVGPDHFRDGVRHYMHDHAFGNTVSTDLWTALQAAAGKPVQGVADDFTRRAGLPLVSVMSESQDAGGVRAQISQSRFLEAHHAGEAEAAAAPWRMPLSVRAGAGPETRMLFAEARGEAVSPGPGPLVVNAGRTSYVRVRYAPALFDKLAAGFAALPAADQIGLLQDGWALGQSQYAPLPNVLALIEAMPADADPIAWAQAAKIVTAIDRAYDGSAGRAAFDLWARERLGPVAARVGWRGASGEAPGVSLLRGPLLLALSHVGDPAVIAEARRIDAAPAAESAETRRIAHMIAARNADRASFDRMVEMVGATHDALTKQHLFEALASVADPALAARVLEIAIGPEAPAGSTPGLLGAVSVEHPDLAWRFVVAHVDAPGFPMDRSTRMETIPAIAGNSADPQRVGELRAYAAAHLPSAAARPVEAASAGIRLNAQVRAEGLPQIDAWLKLRRRR
jgi:aminopeptidase N